MTSAVTGWSTVQVPPPTRLIEREAQVPTVASPASRETIGHLSFMCHHLFVPSRVVSWSRVRLSRGSPTVVGPAEAHGEAWQQSDDERLGVCRRAGGPLR